MVLDTSVLINLHACGSGALILSAIPNRILVPQEVAAELEHETSRENGEHGFLRYIVDSEIALIEAMTDEEYELFLHLVTSSPSLDDGEAATIAIASKRELRPVLDERRGRSRAGEYCGDGHPAGWSLDLLMHPLASKALGQALAVNAVFRALRDGRMRIPPESAESVISAIGEDRARECTCLPKYKSRFPT
ncbi:DNA-binding protein [Pelagibacterium luteolum]|uniref:Predicted nucleic acid-binding protein, contains PIN domain n=1 Tax=Pelagibacterium luteolum TaxID=440168 RepID=A0A1G7Y2U2_9HYPH|nr:DNA-binding protein [Pelagibacterium luteolum]SDG90697.1 Predicted nucleic acid-binding protein, contains PIN domain [Pelagibacterium luteolum]